MIKISPFTPLFFAPSNDISGASSQYVQLFSTDDDILIQVLASEGESISGSIVNQVTGEENALEFDSFTMDSGLSVYNVTLSGLAIGYYSVKISNEESEIFKVTNDNRELSGTTLITYTMHSNKLRTDGVFWNGDVQYTFSWRAPGGFKDDDWGFAVNNEQFETHNGNIVELFAVESTQKSFTLGNALGCPVWYAEHLNRLLCCSDVHFNGVRFVRKGNNVPEMSQEIAGKKSYIFKVALQGMIEGIDIDLPEGESEGESEGGGVGYIYLIKTNDSVEPTDENTFSALRILLEIDKRAKELGNEFLSKITDDTAQGLITFAKGLVSDGILKALGGLEVGEAVDSMLAGKGTIIDSNGRIQADRMELRSSLTVMEIIFNRLSAMESNYAFSESATIESVEKREDSDGNTYYRLTFQKRWENDFHAFQQDDILYGQINTLASGGRDYYTAWMRCLEYSDAAANQVDVVLYSHDQVPGGVNYAPTALMKVIRRGNATNTERQSYWYISAMDEKCIVWLEGVNAPILQKENYYMILGRLKGEIFTNLPESIDLNHSYLYVRGLLYEHRYQVDWEGVVSKEERIRGTWSATVAASDEPYLVSDATFDTVWHNGCKWQCLVSNTLQEPSYASTDWSMIEGNPEFTIDIESSEGWYFDSDDVMIKDSAGIYQPFTTLSVKGKLYNGDVTAFIEDENVSWTRDTGNVSDDNSWAMEHSGSGKVLSLTRDDLGSNFPNVSGVKFTATAFIDDGVVNETDSMSVVF